MFKAAVGAQRLKAGSHRRYMPPYRICSSDFPPHLICGDDWSDNTTIDGFAVSSLRFNQAGMRSTQSALQGRSAISGRRGA